MPTIASRARPGLALALLAAPACAQDLQLPSGHAARLFDVVLEASGRTGAPDAGLDPEADAAPADALGAAAGRAMARFRLVVAGLGGEGAAWEDVAGDFLWVCESLALPALAANGWETGEVAVSLADREVPFGAADADAVQFFEGFRVESGACIPLAF